MIHNGTVTAASILVELRLLGRPQVAPCVNMSQSHGQPTFPIGTLAFYLPIISRITQSVPNTVARDFLLPRQDGFYVMRMQVSVGIQMRQADNIPALNSSSQFA